MKLHRCLPVLLLLVSLPPATAQTAVWIAPGTVSSSATYLGDWNTAANWDTGLVPNASGAVAIVNQSTNAGILSPIPGGALPVVLGDITVGKLRFDLPAVGTTQFTGLYVGSPYFTYPITYPAGHLRLDGAGLIVGAAGTSALTYVDLYVQPDGILELVNQAMILRTGFTELRLRIYGNYDQPARLILRDDAAIATGTFSPNGTSLIGHAAIEFHDRSRAGDWPLQLVYNTSLNFFDQSSAQSAILTSPKDGNGSGVVFNDQATAAQATLTLQSVTFNGHATAGFATITNAGFQNYSGHGQYSSYFTTVLFHDAANAGRAVINNNPFGILAFNDGSSADNATISNQGTVNFSGASSYGSARLHAGSGSYMEGAGYNQSREVITGQVIFQDQATGGLGRIEIASADAIIDFSGLKSAAGTTGRAVLAGTTAAPAVVADDRVAFSLGAITNTAPGGTLYLGGTVLTLGADNSNMTLSARISDVGGRFGSLAGEPLKGGEIGKVGTGTLTLTNPDNNYAGTTGIYAGTLNLAGGTVSNVVLSNASRLTGSGLVRGVLANGAAGTGTLVSPGNSIGTITVTGDYIQFANGTLNMEVASASDSDRLIVNGRAFLSGHLNISLLAGYVPVGNTVMALLTASELNGGFTTISLPNGLGAALSAEVVLTPPSIGLRITQLPFSRFAGGSPAAGALGAHLDATLATATGDYRSLIARLNTLPTAANVSTALDALAPDRYSVLAAHGMATAAVHQAALGRRLAALRGNKPARGFEVFFEAGYRKSRFAATNSLPAAKSGISGGTAGGIWHNRDYAIGASLVHESGDLNLDSLGSRASLKSLTPSVFFQYAPGRFFLQAATAFSHDDYNLQRHIVYPGVDQTALAAPAGRRTDLVVTAGYAFPAGTWILTPHAGLLTTNGHIAGFTETGAGGASMTIADTSLRSTRTRAGVEAVYRSASGPVTPRLSIGWLHEQKGDRIFNARFASAGSGYPVNGRVAEKDLVQASLTLDCRFGRAATAYASLGGTWGRNSSVTTDLSAGFNWRF